jgi:hypothetical protein
VNPVKVRTILAVLILTAVQASAQPRFCRAPYYEGVPRSTDFPVGPLTWKEWLGFDPGDNGHRQDPPKRMDVTAIRRHVWNLWAELTANSRSTRADVDGPLPRWETWFPASAVLAASTKVVPDSPNGLGLPRYEQPPELQGLLDFSPPPPGLQQSQDVFYNQPVCSVMIDHQLGKEAVRTALQQLPGHAVPKFTDETSMALKPIWMTVSAYPDACTPLPVWDNAPGEPKSPTNFPETWPRHVQVRADPRQRCVGETVDLSRFYHRRVLESSQVSQPVPGAKPPSGYQILVGMQVITKEIPSWVWATFWWHDQALAGKSVFAADRNDVRIGKDVWRNYLMDVAVDMDRPWQPDGRPKAVFNPYLEARLPDGTRSNCMTCHARASWSCPAIPPRETLSSSGSKLAFPTIVVTGSEAAKATYFPEADTVLDLRFLWTLARPEANLGLSLLLDNPAAKVAGKTAPPSCPPLLKQQLR